MNIITVITAGLVLALGGCSAVSDTNPVISARFRQTEIGLKWPASPSVPRLELVRVITAPSDLKRLTDQDNDKMAGFIKWLVGEDPDEVAGFDRPYGVHFRNNRLYVVDQGMFCVLVMDLNNGRTRYLQQTLEDDILFYPTAVTVDEEDRVYVCDPEKNRIVIYDKKGYCIRIIGHDFGDWRPCGIAYSGHLKRFYVVDAITHTMKIFDKDFKLFKTVGKQGDAKGEFNFPSHVFVDSRDQVYVTDSMNFRVQKFDSEGRFLARLGTMGTGDGNFARPKGVSVDSNGHIYVVDSLQDSIQVFDSKEQLLMVVGEDGRLPGQFSLPSGIFCDEKNYLYVADTLNRRIQVFKYLGGAN